MVLVLTEIYPASLPYPPSLNLRALLIKTFHGILYFSLIVLLLNIVIIILLTNS